MVSKCRSGCLLTFLLLGVMGCSGSDSPERRPLDKADTLGSCDSGGGNFCGGQAGNGASCWCDEECEGFGDCCDDRDAVCRAEEDGGSPAETWQLLGLSNDSWIWDLHLVDGFLYAATTQGLHRAPVGTTSWEALPVLSGENIGAFIARDDGRLLVGGRNFDGGIFESADNGSNWQSFAPLFGDGFAEPVHDFVAHPTGLLANGLFVSARLDEQNEQWNPLFGSFGGISKGLDVVRVDPHNSEIWLGGQNAIERSVLVRLSSDGNQMLREFENELPVPNIASTVEDLQFHPTDPNKMYAGMEGGLIISEDGGQSWSLSLDTLATSRFIKAIRLDPSNPETIYAASWLKTAPEVEQRFYLYRSSDGGESWQELDGPAIPFGGILSMELEERNGETFLYLGLYGGGVWQVRTQEL